MERYALIVAGGKGERFGGSLPKQFQEVRGTPLLVHTLQAFQESQGWNAIVLVLHPDSLSEWERIRASFLSETDQVEVVEGGKERFHSVRNGLHTLPRNRDAIVAVHDAVRPLIRPKMIRQWLEEAEKNGNAIPVAPLKESIRQLDEKGAGRAMDRSNLRAVQTPQYFKLNRLREAMEMEFRADLKDEASVMEAFGETLHLTEGDPDNIKVTRPIDMKLAELLLEEREKDGR